MRAARGRIGYFLFWASTSKIILPKITDSPGNTAPDTWTKSAWIETLLQNARTSLFILFGPLLLSTQTDDEEDDSE